MLSPGTKTENNKDHLAFVSQQTIEGKWQCKRKIVFVIVGTLRKTGRRLTDASATKQQQQQQWSEILKEDKIRK